jgi:hypothetical protein
MRHLFYIHSYITYIVAMSVIAELELDHNDVCFIYGRGFQFQEVHTIQVTRLPESLMQLSAISSYGERFLFVRKRRLLHKLDSLIHEATRGNNFIAYLPLAKNFMMQLIATHANCRDVAYLEEGLLTYSGDFGKQTHPIFTETMRGKINGMLRVVNHGNRSFYYRPYRHTMPLPVYMLSEPEESVVQSNADDVDFRLLKTIRMPSLDPAYRIDNKLILIIDKEVGGGIISTASFLQTFDFFITHHLKTKPTAIWLRFRPNHPVPDAIINFFKSYLIAVEIIPNEICMESVFHYSKGLTVVGLHSSLLFYAAIWGHESFSLSNILFKIDPDARQIKKMFQLPTIFYRHVSLV